MCPSASTSTFSLRKGFDDAHRPLAARLYWQAFRGKLQRLMAPERKALAFIESALDQRSALSAIDGHGELIGLAGFKTGEGALLAGTVAQLAGVYGRFGALWRGTLLDLLERELAEDELLMDGIFVAAQARGLGVGSALLDAVCSQAAARGLRRVRLDVIDTNQRARSLYARKGFVAGETQRLGPLRYLFGFSSSTTMRKTVQPQG